MDMTAGILYNNPEKKHPINALALPRGKRLLSNRKDGFVRMMNRRKMKMGSNHCFNYMSLRDQAYRNDITHIYDFYLNESLASKGDDSVSINENLTRALLSELNVGKDDSCLCEDMLATLFWLDLYSDMDGGDVVLDYVNRLLGEMNAGEIRRSDILLRRMQHFRSFGFGGEEEDFFRNNNYTDEEVAEIMRFVDGCPATVTCRAAMLCQQIHFLADILQREEWIARKKADPEAARRNRTGAEINRWSDWEFNLIRWIADGYRETGELRLPDDAAREYQRIRATDFHYEDKSLEIKLKNIVGHDQELIKERILDAILSHRVILRKSFFKDATATDGEIYEPWQRLLHISKVKKGEVGAIIDRLNEADSIFPQDHSRALAVFEQAEKEIRDADFENESLACRRFAYDFYMVYSSLLMKAEDYAAALEKGKEGAIIAGMLVNSEPAAAYRHLGAINGLIGRAYKALGDGLNAKTYMEISAYYIAQSEAAAQDAAGNES